MAGGDHILLVMTTVPDGAVAATIARTLVERRLAACVSVQSPCVSTYRWQGVVEQSQEIPLLIKTTVERYPALEAALRDLHPYDVPEIIALDVTQGLPAYLKWVVSETIDEDE
jgi:periplasmic divalent cation tolerance protein